jgi:hypothetical protein
VEHESAFTTENKVANTIIAALDFAKKDTFRVPDVDTITTSRVNVSVLVTLDAIWYAAVRSTSM